MLREHHTFFRHLHLLADLCVVAGIYVLVRKAVTHVPLPEAIDDPALLVFLVFLGMTLATGAAAYEIRYRSFRFTAAVLARRWTLALVGVAVVCLARPGWTPDRFSTGLFAFNGFVALLGVHGLVIGGMRWWRRRGHSYRNAVVVGTGALARRTADTLFSQPERGIRIIAFISEEKGQRLWRYRDIPCRGDLGGLPELVKSAQVDLALFCLDNPASEESQSAVRECLLMGVPVVFMTDWFAGLSARRQPMRFCGCPALALNRSPVPSYRLIGKQVFDRVAALFILVLTAPLMLLVAIAIKWTMPGSVFFVQTRLGLNGHPFKMLKFRSMMPGAERLKSSLLKRNEMSGPVFKLADDPRVTRLGRWLRRSSIDELPQLINVIKGEMSLVGPRPPLPEEVRQYDAWQRRRLSVKPGLTGLWQVEGRNDVDFDEWMRLDMYYIDNWSMKKDAAILLKTIPAVFRGRGAR